MPPSNRQTHPGCPAGATRDGGFPGTCPASSGRAAARVAAGVLVWAMAALPGCGDPERPLLHPAELTGRTPEALMARLGAADMHIEETPARIGFLRWNDLGGIRVLVAYSDSNSTYVTYRLPEEGPFDEEQAFRTLGLRRPSTPGRPMEGSPARVWDADGDFPRIMVNPFTRLISVGPLPDWAKQGIRHTEASGPLDMLRHEPPAER